MARIWLIGSMAAGAVLAGAGIAKAGLEVCNDTDVFQTVAIGYLGDEDWTSEGWWLIEPGGCAEPIGGDLGQRYYYLFAVADGYAFSGDGFGFCTSEEAFTIVGLDDCEARGYTTADFREIDTGETALHHVERITAELSMPEEAGPTPEPEPEPGPMVEDDGNDLDTPPDTSFPDDGPARDANPRRGGSRG